MGVGEEAESSSARPSRRQVIQGAGLVAAGAVGAAMPGALPGVAGVDEASAETTQPSIHLASAQAAPGPFTMVPASWGSRWRAARADAGSRHVRVHFWGDSITVGDQLYPNNESWAELVSQHLRTTYGDGGSGWLPHGVASRTGSWTGGMGMGGAAVTATATGASLTWTGVRGTTINLWHMNKQITGSFQVQMDGGAAQTVTTPVGYGQDPGKVVFSGLSDGPHNVVVTVVSGTVTISGCEGVRGTTGILPARCAQHGRAASDFNDSPGIASMTVNGEWLSAGGVGQPDLVVVALGVNDPANLDYTGETVRDGLSKLMRPYVWDTELGWTPDLVVLVEHRGKWYDQGFIWPAMTSELTSFAAGLGAACIDIWGSGRRSWKYWEGLGYWAGGGNAVHPSPLGHQQGYAAPVIALLDS